MEESKSHIVFNFDAGAGYSQNSRTGDGGMVWVISPSRMWEDVDQSVQRRRNYMGRKAAVIFFILVAWLTGCSMPETTGVELANPETENPGAAGSGTEGYGTLEAVNYGTGNFELADSENGDEEREAVDCKAIDSIYTFKQIYMYGEQSGWALTTENELLFTEEGIESFSVVRKIDGINAATDGFLSASFFGGHTAYLAYFPEEDGQLTVEYTNDGGVSWQKTLLDYTGFGSTCDAGSAYLAMADEKTGYLLYCSTPGTGKMTKILLETADGGRTFNVVADLSDQIAGYPRGLTFHGKKGYIAVSYHGVDSYLYTTADGGITWEDEKIASAESIKAGEKISYIDGYPPVFSRQDHGRGIIVLKMVNENTVYQVFETADGGSRWNAAGKLPCDSLGSYSLGSYSLGTCSPGSDDVFLFLDGEGKLYAVSD